MKGMIRRLIEHYGSEMEVISGDGSRTIHAFLQLVTSKSWQNMERMIPAGGEILRGQYLFIGDVDCGVKAEDVLRVEDRSFFIRRVDAIRFRDQTLYYWGLCVEGGGADPWAT